MNPPPALIKIRRVALILIPIILGFTFCAPVLGASADPASMPGVVSSISLLSPPLPDYLNPEGHSSSPGFAVPQPDPDDPALKLTFPTPEPTPLVEWRPPLYEVPWALNPHDHFYFIRPIANDETTWFVEDYRYGDIYPDTDTIHTGIDIAADIGTPILAAGSGKIVWVGEGLSRSNNGEEDPYGLAVVILHDFGFNQRRIETVYGHMNRIDVTVGQRVEVGDQIGLVGNTGFSSGPHLHFEVRTEEGDFFITRNPELWLVPPQGWGVLAGRLMKKDGTPFYNLEVVIRSLETGKIWKLHTYNPTKVHSDDYYNENFVLSDLPAGDYEVKFKYFWISETIDVTILPGAVTYFTFRNTLGVSRELPQMSQTEAPFIPAPLY